MSVGNDTNRQIFPEQSAQISEETQQRLNQPLVHPKAMSEANQRFLTLLLDKIAKKEIDLYRPSSLYNHQVYDALSSVGQAKAEINALNILNSIREIYRLWQANPTVTYQLENLLHQVRVTKERLEEAGGDMYII